MGMSFATFVGALDWMLTELIRKIIVKYKMVMNDVFSLTGKLMIVELIIPDEL